MPERSHVTRLRASGGPSHELLVLLDQHRVLTTDQLARATGTPVRTVRYRLDQLHTDGLVGFLRPGRETGSAPHHWWLRPAGARLVSGVAAAAGRQPSGLFAAHAAAIAEVWLALREHGPAAGVELTNWAADRAGWQEWEPGGMYETRLRRLTPDGVLRARVDVDGQPGETAAFIEVDLATMTQGQLRERLQRYLVYARDRAWEDVHPHCPPMLLLTTTPARATNFIAAARKVLDRTDRHRGGGFYYRYDRAGADIAAADQLVVAACGLVRDPARAVVEPCWLLPEEAAAELTLTELLAERVATQARADAWRDHQARVEAEQERAEALDDLARTGVVRLTRVMAEDAQAAEALDRLVTGDGFAQREPDLAARVIDWWGTRRSGRRPQGSLPAQLLTELRARHGQIWAEHVQAVLGAGARIAADDPWLAGAAARLQAGRLLTGHDLAELATPPEDDRRRLQVDALAQYIARRDTDVAAQHQRLPWLARRRTSPAELADAYDARQLLVCDTCAMPEPRPDPDRPHWAEARDVGDRCRHCRTGTLIEPGPPVPTLADRLADLKARLRARRRLPGPRGAGT